MMRVLVLANKFPYPPHDGGAIATLAMIKGFYACNCNVTVAAINTSKHYFDKSKLPESISRLAEFYDFYVDTTISFTKAFKNMLFSRKPYIAERFFVEEFKLKLIDLLKSNSFDVVQLEGLYMCAYIPVIRKYSSAKIAYRAHNIEYEIWERTTHQEKNIIKKFYLLHLTSRIKRMEKNMINTYDYLIPISLKDLDGLNDLGNKKPSKLCQTGIDTSTYIAKSPQKNQLSVFHLGGLDWMPNFLGINWFIDNCWERVLREIPEAVFEVGGRNAPQWLIEKLCATKNVRYVGEVDDAFQFFANNSVMIVPLFAGSGMRIKIVEGFALQKAIVSTSTGVEGIPAAHGKEIMIADNADEFVTEIVKLLKNPELIKKVGENAVIFVREKFNNSKIVEDLISFYENCSTHS